MLICNTPPTPSLLLANDGYDNLNINACSHHSRSRCHRLNVIVIVFKVNLI